MNFLFVDRIFEFEPSRSAKGIKHVTPYDTYLKVDRDGRNVLSSCIIGEALGQLTAWVVMETCDFSKRPVAGIADEVKIYRDVYLGETILLHTEIEAMDDQSVLYNSYATVCGETVFSLKHAVGPLLPMEDFIDAARAREQFNMIYRLGSLSPNVISAPTMMLPEMMTGSDQSPGDEETDFFLETLEDEQFLQDSTFYDHILDLNSQSVTAQKNVSLLAPYFTDHFPRKPVVPLSLLLEGKLELACFFLQRTLGEEEAEYYSPTSLRRIRIKQFILPGDSIVTTLHLKEKLEQGFLFSFKTQVDGKTICSLESVFESNHLAARHLLEVSKKSEKI